MEEIIGEERRGRDMQRRECEGQEAIDVMCIWEGGKWQREKEVGK